MNKKFNLKTYFVYYANKPGGKPRPLLIHITKHNRVAIWKLTTKYVHKSKYIKPFHFPLFHWYEYGLNRPSYIDTKLSNLLILSKHKYDKLSLSNKPTIGYLNYNDQIEFLKFINKHYPFLNVR